MTPPQPSTPEQLTHPADVWCLQHNTFAVACCVGVGTKAEAVNHRYKELAAQRAERPCAFCSEPFVPTQHHQVFHTKRCKRAAEIRERQVA